MDIPPTIKIEIKSPSHVSVQGSFVQDRNTNILGATSAKLKWYITTPIALHSIPPLNPVVTAIPIREGLVEACCSLSLFFRSDFLN